MRFAYSKASSSDIEMLGSERPGWVTRLPTNRSPCEHPVIATTKTAMRPALASRSSPDALDMQRGVAGERRIAGTVFINLEMCPANCVPSHRSHAPRYYIGHRGLCRSTSGGKKVSGGRL